MAPELPAALARIVVHNKCDLAFVAPHAARYPAALDGRHLPGDVREVTHVWLCALTGDGLPLLEAEMLRIAGASEGLEDAFFARSRHLEALEAAGRHLEQASGQLRHGNATLELFAEELRAAQSAFSAITGAFTADDLLGEIFSRFCIGK
jgi:tRNA modification GTPase